MPYVNGKWQAPSAEDASKDMNAYKALYGNLSGMGYNYNLNVPSKTGYDTSRPTYTKKETSTQSGGGGGNTTSNAAYLALLAQQQARAEQLAAQKQAAAQAAYDKNMAALNDAYAQRGDLLEKNYNDTLAQLQGQYDYGAQQVNQNADRAQQQAYINYMMSKRDLPQQLVALGLTGGASESRLAGLYNSYGNARNEVDTGRNNDISNLLQTLNQNKSAALQNYNAAISDDAARKLAYQMELEQNLANQTADILTDKYQMISELDSAYAQQMAALVKNQGQANSEPQNYIPSNESQPVQSTQATDNIGTTAIQSARNAYSAAIRSGMSESEALTAALGRIHDVASESGLSDDQLLMLGNQFRGLVR